MTFACHPIWIDKTEAGVDREAITAYKINEDFLSSSLHAYFRVGCGERIRDEGRAPTILTCPYQEGDSKRVCLKGQQLVLFVVTSISSL